jgi:hypothetical protein
VSLLGCVGRQTTSAYPRILRPHPFLTLGYLAASEGIGSGLRPDRLNGYASGPASRPTRPVDSAIIRKAEAEGAVTDDNLKLYVDATRPATLNDGVGSQTDFATLEAAVVAWRALPADVKIRATVKSLAGRFTGLIRSIDSITGRSQTQPSDKAAQIEFPDSRRGHGGSRSRVL